MPNRKAAELRIHTKKEYIQLELEQSNEYKLILAQGQYFPNDFTLNISRDLKLLSIPGSMLTGEQWIPIRRLAENTKNIFRWFDQERRAAFPALAALIEGSYYEKAIIRNDRRSAR
jgi:DNA mismatch repair protein MutS2